MFIKIIKCTRPYLSIDFGKVASYDGEIVLQYIYIYIYIHWKLDLQLADSHIWLFESLSMFGRFIIWADTKSPSLFHIVLVSLIDYH